jgi:hypothetical protein
VARCQEEALSPEMLAGVSLHHLLSPVPDS